MNFDELAQVVRTRRTSMLVDRNRPIPTDVVAQLCELVQWAPNHKRTWPARFAAVQADARVRLGNVIADVLERQGEPPEKVVKTRGKYLRTPLTLVVGSAVGDSVLRTAENRDAVAAGIQNLLLGATTLGLCSFWGSCSKGANDAVAQLCEFPPDTHVSALIYLGWKSGSVETPSRPPAAINWLS